MNARTMMNGDGGDDAAERTMAATAMMAMANNPSPPSAPSAAPAPATSMSPLLALYLRTTLGPQLDPTEIWSYLPLRSVYQLRALSSTIRRRLEYVEYSKCRDGLDYRVPFPGYPGVLATKDDLAAGNGLFTHQLASLRAMHQAENRNTSFGSLRGGILGDAPGLGKTITMLALIASTAGLRPVEPREFFDGEGDSVDDHWRLLRTNPVFRTEILRALRPLRDAVYGHNVDGSEIRFSSDSESESEGSAAGMDAYWRLVQFVSPPYTDDRLPTLTSFVRCVKVAMSPHVSSTDLELFRRNVNAFKAGLDKRNRRYFATSMGKRVLFERSLIPCSSTLIIVPDALLEHWAEQIRRHVHLDVFAEEVNMSSSNGKGKSGNGSTSSSRSLARGVVYIDGVGDLATARFPLNHRSSMPLPNPFHLLSHTIVVVPFSRIEEQYHSRKRRRDQRDNVVVIDGDDDLDDAGGDSSARSSLLQLRWFRVVVDEGHELGENEASSNVTRFIHLLAAERRWVLSGTPTTGNEDDKHFTAKGLDQLQRLLLFLRHETYGTKPRASQDLTRSSATATSSSASTSRGRRNAPTKRQNQEEAKSAWESRVKGKFLAREEAGRKELYRVLAETMIMHKKENVNLFKPIFRQAEVTAPIPEDVQSALLEAVRSDRLDLDYYQSIRASIMGDTATFNLQKTALQLAIGVGGSTLFDHLLSGYLATDAYQTVVDEAQAAHIVDVVKRERMLLEERGGAIVDNLQAPITAATDASCSESRIDRRPIKACVYSESHTNLLSVAEHLYNAFPNENIAELTEGRIADMSYELGRFRNGKKEGKCCPICGAWNEFRGEKLKSCSKSLVEVSDADGRTFLIEPERIIRAVSSSELTLSERRIGNPVAPMRLEGAPMSTYRYSQKKWRVDDALLVDVRDPHPVLQKRWSLETWKTYGSERCDELARDDDYEGRDGYLGPLPEYEDGTESEALVCLKKWQTCRRFHGKSRWYKGPTLEDCKMQTEKEDVFLLCLDASLSHGLDLSFVTHLFLLEPIDDAALLEQVTSRAHRLGATGPVVVETVNVFKGLDEATTRAVKDFSTKQDEEKMKASQRAICDHCYRSFENKEKAETHELTCDRNPDGHAVVDPFHLSAVYRDIRPPPPLAVGTSDTTNQ